MGTRILIAKPLTREAFAPYGDVIDASGPNRFPINSGMTERIHDLATAEAAGPNGRVILSIARGKPYETPLKLGMVERHPFGSQAFVPLAPGSFLVVVAPDAGSGPGEPQAFLARAGQGVNYPRGRWHGVLTPLGREQDFLIVDRAGNGDNLEEFYFPEPYEIRLPGMSVSLIERLFDVIENDIVPLTEKGVAKGNKLFGAAILKKSDLSLVVAETNNELENPLWHGEMHALKRFYELPKADRPATKDCLFLATHEPCTLCMSAITWAGFDNFHYFFSHEDSRDAFAIPHDLRILKEVFGLEPGGYRAENAYWKSYALKKLAREAPDRLHLEGRIARIADRYRALSVAYQAGKAGNDIPLN